MTAIDGVFSKLAACASLVLLSGLVLAQQVPSTSASAERVKARLVVYRGATLIDGTGAPARRDMAVVVENEKIAAVVPVGDLGDAYKDATAIDARGLHVLPGLIDTHVHLATSPDRRNAETVLRRQLYSGVTAVRDMAGDARALADLSRAALVGEIPAPDVYYAALMAGPGFFKDPRTAMASKGVEPGAAPWMQAITAQTDLPLAIAMARGTGATGIKIYADLPDVSVAAIVSEAHRQGMPVWAHAAVFPATPEQLIDARVDVLSHGCLLANHISDRRRQSIRDRVTINYGAIAGGDDLRMSALFRKMRDGGVILDATASTVPPPPCTSDVSTKLAAQAHREGVLIAAGTDYETPWQEAYPALHKELETLSKAGLSALDVIKAATSIAARTLGRQDEFGTIEPGKLANLVFVSRDPLQDIGNLRSVEFTVKRGVMYRRADYPPLTADQEHASAK